MFSDDGIFQLTPAESGHCGLLIQNQKWFLDNATSLGLKGAFVFTQAFVDDLQKDEQAIKDEGNAVEYASLKVFVNLIDAVGNFCNFDKRFDTKGKLGAVLGSKCSLLTKVDQAAEHFMLHMRNHFLVVASDQRKTGGSELALVVSLLGRMKRDHKQAKSKTAFVEWFKDKSVMQMGLANHTLALSIDGKAVCNEAIEELLLSSGVTAADIWSCTVDWSKACALETTRVFGGTSHRYLTTSSRQGLKWRSGFRSSGRIYSASSVPPARIQIPLSAMHLLRRRTPPLESVVGRRGREQMGQRQREGSVYSSLGASEEGFVIEAAVAGTSSFRDGR
jgi:hypothetical protein